MEHSFSILLDFSIGLHLFVISLVFLLLFLQFAETQASCKFRQHFEQHSYRTFIVHIMRYLYILQDGIHILLTMFDLTITRL